MTDLSQPTRIADISAQPLELACRLSASTPRLHQQLEGTAGPHRLGRLQPSTERGDHSALFS